ncbi:MAG: phage tail tape measure protein [Lachnospiraceae bacterium]|nr:phage tail tape measure protein [Lachnospiraceae bacterium]
MGTISNKIVLEGEKEYNAALKEIKTAQAELRSEMKLSQATYKDNQNSLDALKEKHEILSKQYEVQTRKVEVYQQAIEKSQKKEEEATKKVEELKKALSDAENEMDQMEKSSSGTSEALEAQSKTVHDLKEKLALAEQGYDKAVLKTEGYRTSLNYASAEQKNLEAELKNTEKYIEEASDSTDQCAESIDRYGKETAKASEQTSIFGDVIKANILSEAIISGIKALANGIKSVAEAAIESGSGFEAAMSKTEALSGATGEELEALTAKAKEMGATTMFSASQSAEAFQYMALAGWKTGEMLEGIEPIMNLAAAADLDLAKASDIVTDYLTAFGLEAKDASKFADQMAYAMANSNTSAEQLGEAYKHCAATASSMGVSVEETTAVLATMANAGVKGGEAGTALSAIMTRLATNASDCGDKLAEYGVLVYNAEGEMNSLSSILDGLSSVWGTLTDQEQASIAKAISGTNHYAKLQTIMAGCSETAEESGKSFNDYAQALEVCDGSAKQMADTMQDNLKGKIVILQSALEGLGIASYECFDDTLKEGVDGATEAVGRLTKSIENGELGVSLRKLSKSFDEVLTGAIDFGEEALPVVIDALTWLLDNSDMVAAGIIGIVAANMQMKVVGPAVEAVQTAWTAYKKANDGATVSQWLLNAAMDANPAGILVTAIVGLTAAVAAYAIINKDSLGVIDETSKKTKELTKDSRALNEEFAKSTSERKSSREGMEAQADVCRKLAGELKELQSKTSLTTEEQARQKMIIEQLNQAMPELNLAIDEQTGLINMSTKALDDNIESMMSLAKAEAAREDLTRIAEDQYEAEKNLINLKEQLEQQELALAEAEENYNQSLGKNVLLCGAVGAAHSQEAIALQNARSAQEELETQIKETQESIDGFASEYAQTMEYISDTEAQVQAAAATAEMGSAAKDAGGKYAGMSEEVRVALAEMQTDLEDTITKQMDLFSEFKGEAELTTEELLNNMQSQVDGITQWADNLAELSNRGIDQGLLKSLEEMGPAGAGYVATFVEMTDEELQKANELFEKSLSLPSEAAEKAIESYAEAGRNVGEGFISGVAEKEKEAIETGKHVMNETLDGMDKTAEINSPSKRTTRTGVFIDEGLETGMKEEKPNVINVIDDICNEIIRTSQNNLSVDVFSDIGGQVPAGMERGIRAGKPGVIKAVQEMCTEAVETAKNSLDIHSPSGKFEYTGEMSGEGYIVGWKKSMANIDAVIEASLPDTSMGYQNGQNSGIQGYPAQESKIINVQQDNYFYSTTDDMIETSRKFKDTMKEAARDW